LVTLYNTEQSPHHKYNDLETISWILFQRMDNKNIDSQSESIPLDRAPAFKVSDDKTAVHG